MRSICVTINSLDDVTTQQFRSNENGLRCQWRKKILFHLIETIS